MGPVVKVALHGLPQSESLLEPIRSAAQKLAADFPRALSCRVELERTDGAMEAHVEVLLPQQQIIVNRAAASADVALREALSCLHA
jgi:hypothetical protein